MSRYKRYEKYKDSGVEWIGEIPEHWEIGRLKNSIKSCRNGIWGDEPQGDNNDIACIRVTDFNRTNMEIEANDLTIRNIPASKQKLYLLKYGDLLIEKSGGGEKQPVGFVTIFKHNIPAVYANFIARIELDKRKAYSGFFKYIYSAMYSIRLNVRSIKQTTGIQNLDTNYYFDERVMYPPLNEQIHIANFLDQKTAEIDDLIADKEKLIELLQEKRQAIITEAVTKGLNPNVKMKDSGIEWIGEIPEHWSITKMKYLLSPKKYSIKAGPFGSQLKNDDMVSGDVKVYNQKTVLDNDFKSGDYYIENYKYEELRAFEVFSGDLLVTTRGTIGKTAIVPKDAEKGILHPCLIKITLNPDKVLNEYINVVFNNTKIVTNQIMLESNATTIDVIYTDTLKNLVLPIPPLEEQKSIIDFVDAKIGEIDGLISSINNQIQKLKEYRQSLISEAVTGKIDVRDYVVD